MFYLASKLLGAALQPSNLVLLMLMTGLALLIAGRARRISRLLVAVGVAVPLLAGLTPLPQALLAPLERRFPPPSSDMPSPDGIVVLGGAIDPVMSARRGQPALNHAAERMTAAVALALRYPGARVVFAGGAGGLPVPEEKEADAARALFASLGLAPDRVLYERASRNTRENATFAKALADPQPGERWLLVTSAFHMPRAVGVFRAAGWEVVAWPVDHRTPPDLADVGWMPSVSDGLSALDLAAHEWLGLAAYRLTGRTQTLFPAP
ncbi:MAG: YdcF family protein [Alphaproteobacteria bacterium]|nr:YdcF family protein [Alphaproteobacteria bacterium]MDX5370145.1 YdcF family protein [Alphaproteobacteria bacterium]MDX5464702.1 YdcF family protein [Alphaproteobacteria bacterium]